MSAGSPAVILFDINGNPVAVSGGMVLPLGALGQLMAGVDPNGFVRYLSTVSGSLMVTGSLAANVVFPSELNVANFPLIQAVSASAPLPVWQTGQVSVSGTVSLGSQISVNNFPAVQAVSGTIGAVIQNWPAVFGVSGSLTVIEGVTQTAQNVSSSGGLRVFNDAPVGISASVPLQVWSEGSFGVTGSVSLASQISVNNFPATQNVSGNIGAFVQNWPATIGVSASVPLKVWDGGVQGFSASIILPVWNQGTVGVSGTVNIGTMSQMQVSNFPAVQAISGGVVVQNWPATIGISGSTAIRTWDGGIQAVSGTVTANVTVTGSTGLLVAAPAVSPLWITGSVTTGGGASGGGLMTNAQGLNSVQAAGGTELNVIAMSVSLTGAFSASNGQIVPLISDSSGSVFVREQWAPIAEDNFNGVIAYARLPVTASQYTWNIAYTTVLSSASQVKSSNGILRALSGRIDASAATANYYIKIFNTAVGVVSGTAMTYDLCAPLKVSHISTYDNFFNMDFIDGIFFSNGCQVAVSTTEFTYAPAAAIMSVNVEYK